MKIGKTLNPAFETLVLLFLCSQENDIESDYIEELDRFGIDGSYFWQKYCRAFHKYTSVFKKNMLLSEGDEAWLRSMNEDFYSVVIDIFLSRPELLEENGKIEEYQMELIQGFQRFFDKEQDMGITLDTDGFIQFADSTGFNAEMKWLLLQLLTDPQPVFQRMDALVKDNIQTFEKAFKAVEKPIEKLMSRYLANAEKELILTEDVKAVYPSMALPLSQLVAESGYYCGLLVEDYLKLARKKDSSPGVLVSVLKALGDKSKLEILSLLKSKPMYSQEIAEYLDLTPATVSHHMNTLLSRDLVYLEKSGGKFYYHNNTQVLKDFIKQLENYVL